MSTQVNSSFKDREKPTEVRRSNIMAARAVADAVRTSLGPKGMDKMVQTKTGEVIITNDGHTILQHIAVIHPAARMLVELSAAQDSEAGDGTTSVVVICGSLLCAGERLLDRGIKPTLIATSFQRASLRAVEIMRGMSHAIELTDRRSLVRAATTSLSSKIVSQYSQMLAPMCVDAVLKVVGGTPSDPTIDLRDIRQIKKLGGTIENTKLVDGLVLRQSVVKNAGGPTRIEKARIALVQFQLSPPKPDLENHVIVNDYRQMDKILKEERQYLLNMCKVIKKNKCNVLLIQKSILRDAVNDMALHFLAKLGIMVIKDIERDEVEFISKTLGCQPIADIESFSEDRLGQADLVEETEDEEARITTISGITGPNANKTCSIVVRGSNNVIVEETERSIHDALCVIRCLVRERALIAGGGAPEIEVARVLGIEADKQTGVEAVCWREYAQALEIIPTTLAENAGMNAIEAVTELRNKHANGAVTTGISTRRGTADITTENVLQPLLVNTSEISLATECVKSILRIDDIQFSR